jgi:NodT family efflux transporter outer membrane factor (OMF) lipoprotein
LRAARDAARQDASVAAADLAGARLSLAARTAQNWFDLIEARMQADLAKTQLARRRQVVDLVRGRFQRGIGSGLELRLALTESAFDESRVAERENQWMQARRRLEALLGRYPSGQIDGVQDLPALPDPAPIGLPSQLLGRRPDLIATLARLRAADLRVRAAELDRLPRLTLNGSVGTNSDTLSRLADPAFLIWNVAGGLVQPMFTGGRLTQQINLNQARAEEELARYRDSTIKAFREVEDALTTERRLSEQERSLAEAVRQAEASLELAQYSYRNGLVDILFLLQSLQSRLDTRSQHLTVRRQLLNNRLDLYLALGGGFGQQATPVAGR